MLKEEGEEELQDMIAGILMREIGFQFRIAVVSSFHTLVLLDRDGMDE